ncbi:MAG: calcium-binding protein [Thermoplasmata archaeon]
MPRRRGRADLDALIEEATVDCNDPSEQESGFYEMLDQNLRFPFLGKVVGEEVSVTGVDVEEAGLVAVCARKGKKYRIALLSVDIPEDVPGREWLDAYRKFRRAL